MTSISPPIISTPEHIYDMIKEGKSLSTKISYSYPKKNGGKSINLTLGKIWFNNLLPANYPLINKQVTKKDMDKIIIDLYKTYGAEEASNYITKLQTEAFKLATLCPNTFNIDVFIPPPEWNKEKEEFEKIANQLDPLEFKEKAENLTKKLLSHFEEMNFRVNNIMNSGAKGNPISDWGSLLTAKGYVIDIEGNLLGPIVNSLNNGYQKTDYYNAASESRKNFYIRSSLTAHPGYLIRKMVNANSRTVIDQKIEDCKTERMLNITITDKLAKILLQRNYISQTGSIKTITTGEQITGKKIKLRTPLYCQSKDGICPVCYGNLYKTLNTTNVGILASSAINVVGINTMMGMRHKSSSVDIKTVDFIEMIKNSGINITTINHVLEIGKNEIFAKRQCTVTFNISEYNDVSLIDCGDKYQIAGILTIQYGELQNVNFITLPFAIMVDLFKPADISIDGNIINLTYEPGELLIKQQYYDDSFNERTLDRLFEGGAKYITNPEVLTMTIHNKLPEIDLVHIESIVSNMFRNREDLTEPARLSNYKNSIIVGQKKLPYVISWLSALGFENINRAIKVGLIEGKDAKLGPLESIVLEKYSKEI